MSSTVPPYVLSPDLLRKLENEYGILHLIYHRNHNQHRVAVWWKDINILHRNIRKLLLKHYEFEDARKHIVKQKLHSEALAIARAMVKKRIFRSCYYSFNGIVALGQFVALGLALLANLSALYSLVSSIDGLNTKVEHTISHSKDKVPHTALSGVEKSEVGDVNEDDLGEEVEFVERAKLRNTEANTEMHEKVPDIQRPQPTKRKMDFDDIESIFGEKPKKKKKEKKPKEKKKKSAMDDIFG